jgi:hypothetical protein
MRLILSDPWLSVFNPCGKQHPRNPVYCEATKDELELVLLPTQSKILLVKEEIN